MNGGGRVSVKTALELMQTTEDWDKVLEITNGTIRLRQGAEEDLIQTKLTAIKTQLHYAWTTAKARYETALAAQGELDYADNSTTVMTAESIKAEAIGRVSAVVVSLGAAMDKLVAGEWGSVFSTFGETYKTATATVVQDAQQYKTTLGELRDNAAKQKQLYDAFSSVDDPAKFMENHDFNETPGDKYDGDKNTKEEEDEEYIEDGWKKLLAKYDNQLELLSNERDLIQAEIDKAEAKGGKASAKYYEDLKRNSEEEKNLLIQKKAALEQYLEANKNVIDQDTWTEYNNEINETAVAIKECEQNTIEWAEALREIDLHYFEQATDEISRLGDELDLVNSLLEDEEVADENGNWSSAALTRMGMYTNQMELAASEAARYKEEIDKLNEQYKKGELSEEQYQESLSDLVSGQHDTIQSYEDAKDSIVDMNEARIDAIKDGIEKEIEAYEDLIDAKKEELDAERSLYDFRKNIQNQTKDIAELERRIASLSGSTAAADVAEKRKLQAQLNDARSNLDDTYYDHSRDAQQNALDEESRAYSTAKERYIEQLEEQLKDTETLIQNSIMDVLLNADMVYTELNNLADLYGIDLSDSLTQPWKDASAQAVAWKNELARTLSDSELMLITHENGVVTAFSNGVATKLQGTWNKAQTAAKNYAGYLTSAELRNRFTNTLTGFGNQIQNIINKWNGVKAAADAAYAAQTRKVTVGGTETGDTGDSGSGGSSGGGGVTGGGGTSYITGEHVKMLQKILNQFFQARLTVDGVYGPSTTNAVKAMKNVLYKDASSTKTATDGKYDWETKAMLQNYLNKRNVGSWFRKYNLSIPSAMYSKGTTGTTRDQWAITDEPQFGDELTMYATPDGTLSFMRAGSTVIPADLTRELIDLPKVVDGLINRPKFDSGINMITNAINKPEIVIDVENFLKVDRVDKDSLPQLEAMMDKKIDTFAKQLNYSIKKFAR